eukprot:7184392-Prymnesium_polylepis.1
MSAMTVFFLFLIASCEHSPALPLPLPMASKQGWLKKQSPSAFAGLQKRWFSLKEGNLYYFKDDNEGKDAKGVIPLSALKGCSTSGPNIEIDVGYRVFKLVAASDSEAAEWATVLDRFRAKPKAAARMTVRRAWPPSVHVATAAAWP